MSLHSKSEKDPASRQLAALWPSGVIKQVSEAAVRAAHTDINLSFDVPTGEREERRAEVLANCLRISPALVGVLELPADRTDINQPVYGRDALLPPGERVVVVPLPAELAA